jgi:hypothetical protein
MKTLEKSIMTAAMTALTAFLMTVSAEAYSEMPADKDTTITTGINEREKQQEPVTNLNDQRGNPVTYKIYPLPATTEINIELSKALAENSEVEIYNMAGQRVITESLPANSRKFCIYLKNIPSGPYIFTVKTKEIVYCRKIAVRK